MSSFIAGINLKLQQKQQQLLNQHPAKKRPKKIDATEKKKENILKVTEGRI